VDNPSDPGGPTNMGVTQATLSAHLGRQVTAAEVRGMTQETAAAIYFHDYWQANRCGEMPPGVDLVMLDCVVMSGPAHPRRWLQHAVGVAEDGVLGADTMAALSHVDAHQIIQAMTAQRCQYYQSLPMWPYFRNGWDARIQATHLRATGMAAG
jgi:lysozyme family protein